MKNINYTGLTFSGCASTPHTLTVYIRGNVEANFDLWEGCPTGEEVRLKYAKLRGKLEKLLSKIK